MNGVYGRFAQVYDKLQQDVPYAEMAKLFDGFIKEYSSENEVVVDLACGTGNLSEEMYRLGYDVIGIDLSQDMLNEALEKKYDKGLDISYLCQDMTELDLYGAADVVICVLDSLNHLSCADDFEKTVERVSMFTCDGGLFIFDVNTLYKHRVILGDNVFCYDPDGLFCVWRNETLEDGSVNIALDFFEEREDGSYSRYGEEFREIVFPPEFIEDCLSKNHFEMIGRFDGFSKEPPCDESQRILYVCRRSAR